MNDTPEEFEARVAKWEDYYSDRDKREAEFRKEVFLQGIFAGFAIGVIYLAVFSTILERL